MLITSSFAAKRAASVALLFLGLACAKAPVATPPPPKEVYPPVCDGALASLKSGRGSVTEKPATDGELMEVRRRLDAARKAGEGCVQDFSLIIAYLEQKPTSAEGYSLLGDMIASGCERSPGTPPPYQSLAKDAADAYRRAATLEPTEEHLHAWLEQDLDSESAQRAAGDFLCREPRDPVASYVVAKSKRVARDKAIELLKASDGCVFGAKALLGSLLEQKADARGAAEAYRKELECRTYVDGPPSRRYFHEGNARFNISRILAKTSESEEARFQLEMLLFLAAKTSLQFASPADIDAIWTEIRAHEESLPEKPAIESPDDVFRALHYAVAYGDLKLIRLLYGRGHPVQRYLREYADPKRPHSDGMPCGSLLPKDAEERARRMALCIVDRELPNANTEDFGCEDLPPPVPAQRGKKVKPPPSNLFCMVPATSDGAPFCKFEMHRTKAGWEIARSLGECSRASPFALW